MRPIDADALKEKIEQCGGEGTIARYCKRVLAECLDNDAPTIDAVPVVHGRWIDENPDDSLDPRMRCSICTGIESPLIKWLYCPNCGAKMDEEQENKR